MRTDVRQSLLLRPLVAGSFFAAAVGLLSGCGKAGADRVPVHPTHGSVTLRGEAVDGAFVVLHPKNASADNAPNPRGTTGEDGSFTLSTYEHGDGAPEGNYVVTVQWYRPVNRNGDIVPGPNALPGKYAVPATSGIEVSVVSGENRLRPIELR